MASSTVAAELRKQRQHVIREIHRWVTRNLTHLNGNIEFLSATRNVQGDFTIADAEQHASFGPGYCRVARLDLGQMRHVHSATVITDAGDQELLNAIGSAELNECRLNMNVTERQWFVRRNPTEHANAQPTQDAQSRGDFIEKCSNDNKIHAVDPFRSDLQEG